MLNDDLSITFVEVHNLDPEELRKFTAKVRAERCPPVAVSKGKKGSDSGQLETDGVSSVSKEVST